MVEVLAELELPTLATCCASLKQTSSLLKTTKVFF